METKKMKVFFTVLLTCLIFAALFSVSTSAAIAVENGTVTGLDASVNYQYAPITLANYTSLSYTEVEAGATSISGLSAGLYSIRNGSTFEKTLVWIEGDAEDRASIGTLVYSSYAGKDAVDRDDSTSFVAGKWSGTEAKNHSTFAPYYLSAVATHVATSVSEQVDSGIFSTSEVKSLIESVVFKYAYAPEEIIPVEELYAMTFETGFRQGSLFARYSEDAEDPYIKSKYVLYTMDETGTVTAHTAYFTSKFSYGATTKHSLSISGDFPEAKGWVVGIEIYPFGLIPMDGLEFYASANSDGGYTTNCYSIKYFPNEYLTEGNNINLLQIPVQYNGVNTAYIKGYEDGTFAPDSDITKAEAATIIARILLEGAEIPAGTESSFADISINDWFYNAVKYLESREIFSYVTGSRINADKAITRGELAQIIKNAAETADADSCTFKDMDESHPYYAAICSLESEGIINGYADGTFRPDATITRAEAITVINRVINLIADETTVSKEGLENTFSDIDGHWAEYQILMAANNNVKSVHHSTSSAADIFETNTQISIETDHIRVILNKAGRVTSIINKYDDSNILSISATPWFTYLVSNTGTNIYPYQVTVKDGRLEVTYLNYIKAYFIIDVHNNYFTIELDSELPYNVKGIYFGNLAISSDFTEDADSFRISAVAMNANTDSVNFPGGKAKETEAYAAKKFGAMGAKIGITFSKYGDRVTGEHRSYLKEIVDAIDPAVGTTSTAGGAYALDNEDLFGDYIISSSGISVSTVDSIVATMTKYDIDQLDIHQGSTFVQGDFNFKCAAVTGETFTTAAQFNDRIGSKLIERGIQLGLHTYSSLVSSSATTILSDPQWQKDLAYEEDYVLTLAEDVSSSATNFSTNEDASGLILVGQTSSGGTSNLPWSGPNTGYFLIDEEIIRVSSVSETGLVIQTRGCFGTTKSAHLAGTEIRHLLGHFGMFQSKPGSELFYHIADLTAQAYNDGGFEMIYLDGLESFARNPFCSSEDSWYYYSTFIQRVVSGCDTDPIIEGSSIPKGFWNARGRAGAVDNATRQYKKYNYNHATDNTNSYFNYFYTSTLGWFNYAPDLTSTYKNTWQKTVFIDDLDHMGSIGIAYDMSTVYNHSLSTFGSYPTLAKNAEYYALYSKLRKAHYFSDSVKKTLQEGYKSGKEYKLEEQSDGSWAFREMTYVKNRIFDMKDDLFVTGSANNPYDAQTPYIRIEQRYSTLSANETSVYAFDDTADIAAGTYKFDKIDLSNLRSFKISVTGNGIEGSAVLLSLQSSSTSEAGRLDYFIPTHFTGTREFILVDMDNADYDGYTFSGITISSTNYMTYRNSFHYQNTHAVKVTLAGDCTGVKLGELKAYTVVNAPVENPSVTIKNSTIKFDATVRSGEYIEYFPELGKAYLHSYDVEGQGNGDVATVSEISFTGSVTVPAGDFTFTYDATGTTDAPVRAQVVLGLKSSDIIANESTWTAELPELDDDIQYVTVK